ncbi:MAG: rhamnulokinase [Oscillospiraceae bacterium]|nr:rhamnulokinase [Oscillospiraceae bacterium]
MHYYLAIDLGATSGKHLLAWIEDGKIKQEEIHRFTNRFKQESDTLYWDLDYLYEEILTGMKKCAQIGKIPSFVGLDTWGVDYTLLNHFGELIGGAISYRDSRTYGILENVFKAVPEEELYRITGIQRQPFNTIFQIYAHAVNMPYDLQNTKTLLMLPCYFNYLMTGIAVNEYTVTSTTGLLNAESRNWDFSIIDRLSFNQSIFGEIKPPGTMLGEFNQITAEEVGFSATVVLPAAHDTASAVLAVPLSENAIYLSSGTWSLMGVETDAPVTSELARAKNFTNEGGWGGKYRLLKNIMGLWMLRSVRNNFNDRYSYDEMSKMAYENNDFPSIVDVSDTRFLAPKSMVDEITAVCSETGQPIPNTAGEVYAVIYHSLAEYYGKTVQDIEEITGKHYDAVNIVGGGTRDNYLNQLTANCCRKKVFVGPTEATALGNIAAQMLATGEVGSVHEIKEIIRNSITLGEYNFEPI